MKNKTNRKQNDKKKCTAHTPPFKASPSRSPSSRPSSCSASLAVRSETRRTWFEDKMMQWALLPRARPLLLPEFQPPQILLLLKEFRLPRILLLLLKEFQLPRILLLLLRERRRRRLLPSPLPPEQASARTARAMARAASRACSRANRRASSRCTTSQASKHASPTPQISSARDVPRPWRSAGPRSIKRGGTLAMPCKRRRSL